MTDLLKAIVSGLVEEPDKITVTADEPNDEGVVVYHLSVAEGDMGRVIGKQGRIAKAIRTVMRAAANRNNQRIAVEIDG
ncbi:MAG: KH domain-containing protein [Oscillospiraceae bacterium]